MQMLAVCYAVLAVSTIYCIRQAHERAQLRRERVLRDRVAFMLWTVANQIPQSVRPYAHPGGGHGPKGWRTGGRSTVQPAIDAPGTERTKRASFEREDGAS